MKTLGPPDDHYLSAAVGWLELGNVAEARAEMKRINASHQRHPLVLEIHWALNAEEKNWTAALGVAREILQADPTRVTGWLHQAYALRRVPDGGVPAALDALMPAFKLFPEEPTVAYNIACYACQLGRLEESLEWLDRAFKAGGKKAIKEMAMNDSDLQPLWPRIAKM